MTVKMLLDDLLLGSSIAAVEVKRRGTVLARYSLASIFNGDYGDAADDEVITFGVYGPVMNINVR